jgi:hypothetical protein
MAVLRFARGWKSFRPVTSYFLNGFLLLKLMYICSEFSAFNALKAFSFSSWQRLMAAGSTQQNATFSRF